MKARSSETRPAIVQNTTRSVREVFEHFVVALVCALRSRAGAGQGSYVWDIDGRRYLDFGGGIAVCSLGHAHPEITAALTEQSSKLSTFRISIIMSRRRAWPNELSI